MATAIRATSLVILVFLLLFVPAASSWAEDAKATSGNAKQALKASCDFLRRTQWIDGSWDLTRAAREVSALRKDARAADRREERAQRLAQY